MENAGFYCWSNVVFNDGTIYIFGILVLKNDRLLSYKDFLNDLAMKTQDAGGIDLNPVDKMIEVEAGTVGHAVKFYIDPAMLQQYRAASGFAPVIIDIHPMKVSVPVFLEAGDTYPSGEKLSMRWSFRILEILGGEEFVDFFVFKVIMM